jgi:hypothetical protein
LADDGLKTTVLYPTVLIIQFLGGGINGGFFNGGAGGGNFFG